MAETEWVHLTEIFRNTDNGDINPTNRPFHVYVFYTTFSFVKQKIVEFQNRGAAYLHIVF